MQRLLAIQDLCARLDRGTLSRPDFADRCSALIAAHIGCSAAAIWLLLDASAGRMAQPIGHASMGVRWGLDLQNPCDRFAQSLSAHGAVIAQDARLHAATAHFFAPDLPPSPVRSMLAVPFSVNGDLHGAFVCAHFDQMLRWSAAQLSELRRITVGIVPPLARATSFTMSARPDEPPAMPWAWRRATSPVVGTETL